MNAPMLRSLVSADWLAGLAERLVVRDRSLARAERHRCRVHLLGRVRLRALWRSVSRSHKMPPFRDRRRRGLRTPK